MRIEAFRVGWIIALSALFNFTFGALLPIIPRLSLETAGIAFTFFYLFKALCFAPAGMFSDQLGHWAGLSLSMGMQCLAMTLLLLFPENPWLGRIFEGFGLAQGTISAISLLRISSPDLTVFNRRVKALMGFSGLGFVFGPLAGFLILNWGASFALQVLLGILVFAFAVQVGIQMQANSRVSPEALAPPSQDDSDSGPPPRSFLWALAGFSAAKAISIGWQPLIAWWVSDILKLGPALSGGSFFVLGVMLTVGSLKPAGKSLWILGVLGFLGMELALRRYSMVWWPSLALVGYWWGSYVTLAFARLSWTDTAKMLGRKNSLWLLLTDLPMAFIPVIIWQWRDPSHPSRFFLGVFLMGLSSIGWWFGIQRASSPVLEVRGND